MRDRRTARIAVGFNCARTGSSSLGKEGCGLVKSFSSDCSVAISAAHINGRLLKEYYTCSDDR
jgi:hypothetical protein